MVSVGGDPLEPARAQEAHGQGVRDRHQHRSGVRQDHRIGGMIGQRHQRRAGDDVARPRHRRQRIEDHARGSRAKHLDRPALACPPREGAGKQRAQFLNAQDRAAICPAVSHAVRTHPRRSPFLLPPRGRPKRLWQSGSATRRGMAPLGR